MDIKNSAHWRVRVFKKCYGADFIDFSYPFSFPWIAIKASTTNVHPKNVVGYIHQTISVLALGGKTEVNDRYTLINDVPKVIRLEDVGSPYFVRYRFSMPVGNSNVTIWEYAQPDPVATKQEEVDTKLLELNTTLNNAVHNLELIRNQLLQNSINRNNNYRSPTRDFY